MKNLWISLKITLAMCIVLGVGYVLVLRGVSAVAGPNGGGSGGSNKATTNPEHLAGVEQRVQDFLAAHPYLSRAEVPAEMVTASGSGLDPDISPRGAQAQVRRVAEARGLDIATVRHLVDSLTQKPWLGLFGTEKVNVLRLNVALEELNEN